ncbi:MAG: ATP-binding protein [Crocinitomicaceae bacterium]|nr:ATP-binding protein [Crocinitomicaceae bacterium]
MHSLEISSQLENLPEVEAMIEKVCEELGVNEELFGNVLIAVTEAVNNAIIHGNKSQPSKKVTIIVNKKAQEVIFTVGDEGAGFDFENIPDPTAPENIEKLNGRGIFLMKNLSDNVEFEANGTKVNITFVVGNG